MRGIRRGETQTERERARARLRVGLGIRILTQRCVYFYPGFFVSLSLCLVVIAIVDVLAIVTAIEQRYRKKRAVAHVHASSPKIPSQLLPAGTTAQ